MKIIDVYKRQGLPAREATEKSMGEISGALVTASQDTALTTIRGLDTMYVDLTRSSVDLLRLRKQSLATNSDTDVYKRQHADFGNGDVNNVSHFVSRFTFNLYSAVFLAANQFIAHSV